MKLLKLFTAAIFIAPAISSLVALPPSPPAFEPVAAFPLTQSGLVISRPVQPAQPFTVAGESGVLVGTQDGSFESWILPIKLLSHLTIEANLEGYSVPIPVNPQSANIEVRPDHTTITYSHPGFTIRQIMFSPNNESGVPQVSPQVSPLRPGSEVGTTTSPSTGPIVLFQIDSVRPLDLVFRFTPEMRWMWPRRNDGVPSPEWVPDHPQATDDADPGQSTGEGMYVLHLDYPDLAGAITIPTATPGILAPYQERPQVHPLELHLHYDPKRDGSKFFPLLMAAATTPQTATTTALRRALEQLNAGIPAAYQAHAAQYAKLQSESTSIETPDKSLNEAFSWGVISIEQLKARAYPTQETALVAGYYSSGDSARPGFGWFFGRDALYTLYAINGFGDFALTRAELEFLIARQRADGKIMHEFSQTAADPSVDWKSFPYMYAAADATPLFLMAVRDYLLSSGDVAFLQSHREVIEKAWSFETNPANDTDHDGIYDNSQGTGWVESWPKAMPHQEVYLALLDQQASTAYAALETALGDAAKAAAASARATQIQAKIEQEYYDPQKGCYAFSYNPSEPGKITPNSPVDHTTTIYPAIAYWNAGSSLAHPEACLQQWASPGLDTDWGTRDVANNEPYYDGLSYHQGSVWPLFTGWAALAEYRANQPLAGQQLLMQNVDLTWAQDPGAVTELLSGDYFVPFGRSTSHQLWSSAMVITPALRGLFGINLDAQTNTITVNPHMPAEWTTAQIHHIHLGNNTVTLNFEHNSATLYRPASIVVSAQVENGDKSASMKLRSDQSGAVPSVDQPAGTAEITIPPPPIEIELPSQVLPEPGARTSQLKVLSAQYSGHELKLTVSAPAGTSAQLNLHLNQSLPSLKIDKAPAGHGAQDTVELNRDRVVSRSSRPIHENSYLILHFPQGQGWQTLESTLTW